MQSPLLTTAVHCEWVDQNIHPGAVLIIQRCPILSEKDRCVCGLLLCSSTTNTGFSK
uniref:Uncharacterized protein n=1 Tax=Anguilla anguilla TaxID=7936 RepID=A0A0E9XTA1_ANGAN